MSMQKQLTCRLYVVCNIKTYYYSFLNKNTKYCRRISKIKSLPIRKKYIYSNLSRLHTIYINFLK